MPRRLVSSIVAVLALTACGTAEGAATINGVEIRRSDLEQTVTDFVTIGEAQSNNGVVDTETVRSLLTSLIRAEAINQVISASGEEVTQNDLDSVREQLAEQGAEGLPDTLRELIIELNAAQSVLNRVQAPAPSVIAERYGSNPKSLGMLCVRHLVVEDEATADAARDELGNSPTDDQFAAVAGKYSTEPNADVSGGTLEGRSGPCIGINEWQAGFDPDFVAGALSARTGVPTRPVKSSFGWHVIYVRPFTAVSDSVSANLAEAAGEFLLLGLLADADVSVASRYGRWDPLAGSVVAP
ncbi:MAG: peptidylprolyl isomerase [Ilumatobacteraceae bacterium]